ncbi:MAG: hypothetical protein ABMA00_19605 [Gemmatimonas sp.]
MRTVRVRFVLAAALVSLAPSVSRADDASSPSVVAMQEDVEVVLKRLIDAPTPAGMSDKDRAEYASHSAWIKSAYDRIRTAREAGSGMATGKVAATGAVSGVQAPRDVATGQSTGKRQHGVSPRDIVKFQTTIETESRKFQTLSNASKVRHDIAMNAIRNMK